MNNNSSLQNVYNWGKIYSSPFKRKEDLYAQYLENGGEENTCIRCNKNMDEFHSTRRWCNNCYREYHKNLEKYRSKPYHLLKKVSLVTKCEITGCNKNMLKYYFERQFDNNMNWDNQSTYWQIDHRIPLAWFNLENDVELKFACNYKNLQPMEKELNYDKGCKYPTNNLFDYAFQSENTS